MTLTEPGFWQSVALDMIAHPDRQPLSWGVIIAVVAIVIGFAALHELPAMLFRWLVRSSRTPKSIDREVEQDRSPKS